MNMLLEVLKYNTTMKELHLGILIDYSVEYDGLNAETVGGISSLIKANKTLTTLNLGSVKFDI